MFQLYWDRSISVALRSFRFSVTVIILFQLYWDCSDVSASCPVGGSESAKFLAGGRRSGDLSTGLWRTRLQHGQWSAQNLRGRNASLHLWRGEHCHGSADSQVGNQFWSNGEGVASSWCLWPLVMWRFFFLFWYSFYLWKLKKKKKKKKATTTFNWMQTFWK